jgi:hypothetical protein
VPHNVNKLIQDMQHGNQNHASFAIEQIIQQ